MFPVGDVKPVVAVTCLSAAVGVVVADVPGGRVPVPAVVDGLAVLPTAEVEVTDEVEAGSSQPASRTTNATPLTSPAAQSFEGKGIPRPY
jgi:hypothetical protein